VVKLDLRSYLENAGTGMRKVFRIVLLSVLPCVAFLLGGCRFNPPEVTEAQTVDDRVTRPQALTEADLSTCPGRVIPDIPRFAKVSESLYRGGQPTAKGFAELRKMGVKTIISLRVFDSDRPKLEGLGLRYLHISFKAIHPEDEDVVAFLKTVTDPNNQPVFVHCREGVDRTGMMVAVYRIVIQGWSKEKGLEEMRRMGFNDFWKALEDYIEDLDVSSLKKNLRN